MGVDKGFAITDAIFAPSTNMTDKNYGWNNEHRIFGFLDKPAFIGLGEATELLINIEADSDKYLDTPKRYAAYCNLRDSVELSNRVNGGERAN